MADYRRRMRPMLGTFIEVGTPACSHANSLIDDAFLQIERIQSLLNWHDPSSELSRLNAARGEWVPMSRISLRALRLARALMRASHGRFNFFIGNTADVHPARDGHLLCPGTAKSDWRHHPQIEILNSRARIPDGTKISLDGIAKGFAVDLAIKFLKKSGAAAGWVNAGGDLRVFGELELPIWRRETDGTFQRLGNIKNAAFASSQGPHDDPSFTGKIEGQHGYQAHTGVWSVLAPTAWLADALTKVACVSNEQDRAPTIERLGGWLVPQQPLTDRVAKKPTGTSAGTFV